MLKERVRKYCRTEENCARILLCSAAEEYGVSLSKDILSACGSISGGFGIGGMCSGIVAGVMVLGLLFDAEEVKEKRILFLFRLQERIGFLDCGRLSAMDTDCKVLLEEIAELLQEVIDG